MWSLSLSNLPLVKSNIILASVKAFAANHVKGTAIDTGNRDHVILSKIVAGLEGALPPSDTSKLFLGLTTEDMERATCIITQLSSDDKTWNALTKHHLSLDRSRLPRVHLTLMQTTGSTSKSLWVKPTDRSTLVEKIGGHSDILLASYKGERVAIKRICLYSSMPQWEIAEIKKKFILEAMIWKQLHHRNVIQLYGLDDSEDRPMMVMPWYKRGSVMDFMVESPEIVTALQLNRWILDVLSGLSYLREKDVVHGDLRGCNILISDDGTAVICDFGLAVFASEWSRAHHSQRGGRELWMAPELLDPRLFGKTSARPTFESDVYSFACLCYQLYTRTSPFVASGLISSVNKIIHGERPSRPSGESGYTKMPEEVWAVVQKAWRLQPSERASVQELLTDMKACVPL